MQMCWLYIICGFLLNLFVCVYYREDPMLGDGHFVDIVMDVLSERGYHVSFDERTHHEPVGVDLTTGKIELQT